MPKSKITDDEWEAVRICSEHGMPDDELAKEFFPNEDEEKARATIRKRRSTEKWITKERVMEKAISQPISQKPADRAADILAAKLNGLWDSTRLKAAELSAKAVSQVKEAPQIKYANDILTNLKIIRLAAGMDSGESSKPSVTINLGSLLNQPAETMPVIDV